MKIQRAIPPAAAPVNVNNVLHGLFGILSGERYLKQLEEELKEYFDAKHVFLVSSGKAALTLILKALKSLSPEKHQVLIPAYTCFSVPSAIIKAGLQVSLCDIRPLSFDFDYNLLSESIEEKTLCVMPDHLFGIPSDMDRIMDLCKKRGVFVVEDAAQAMGGDHKGRRLGMIGDVGFFSLDRGKNITCGSGGIIVTNSDYIADEIEREYSRLGGPGIVRSITELIKFVLISILIRPSLYWFPSRLTFLKLGETTFYKDFSIKKLSGMHAGTLRGWQKRLEESNRIRKENASFFIKKLGLQTENGGSIFFLRLPFMVKNREMKESIYILSKEGGLGISRMYPAPINEIREIRSQFEGKMFPFAQETADCLLTLPTHQLLSSEDKEKICSCLMRRGL